MHCNLCYLKKKKGQQDLSCQRCKLLYHRTCLNIDSDTYNKYQRETWTCTACLHSTTKPPTCSICSKTNKRYITLMCQTCKQHFHRSCMKKKFPKHKPDDFYWTCALCSADKQVNEESSNETINSTTLILKGISIGHVNIRDILSLNKKDDVYNLILQYQFHVFGVSETWLHKDIPSEEVAIPGYKIYRQDRKNKGYKQRGGGLLLYIRDEYEVKEIEVKSSSTEIIHITISRQQIKPIHIILVYKPPTVSSKTLISSLQTTLQNCNDTEYYYIGDFNINFLSNDSSTKELKSFMNDHNMDQLITQPTRVTSSTATLIDCIFTNRTDINSSSGIIEIGISDHSVIYTCRKKPKSQREKIKIVEMRSFKDTKYDEMRSMITNGPWWIFKHCSTLDKKYEMFEAILKHVLNIHAPIIKMRIKSKRKPWMNAKYDELNRKLRKARQIHLKENTNTNRSSDFKILRNKVNHFKTALKKSVIKNIAQNSETDSKQMWKVLNCEVGRATTHEPIPELKVRGNTIFDDKIKLNKLAEHFTQNICNKPVTITLPQDNSQLNENENSKIESLSTFTVNKEQVELAIQSLKSNKPSGRDGLPARFFKACAQNIAPPLTYLINEMLKTGEFPNALKTAIVTPIYKKKGEKNDVKSYRPISILPTTAKIIDSILYRKLIRHFEQNELLMDEQHGYRKSRSTQSAVTILTDNIKKAVDQKKITGTVFFDFVQAFDKVNYTKLLEKLHQCHIRGNVLKLFQSYFSDRKLIVKKNNIESKPYFMQTGCPQGSSVSALIFCIYINDTKNIFEHSKFVYYADDLAIFIHGDTVHEIQEKLQKDIHNMQKWCKENNMQINIGKTKCMIFKNRNAGENSLKLKISNKIIECVDEFKYLGILLNGNPNFNSHYENTCKAMTTRMFMINRYKKFFSPVWKNIFATSLVLSKLDYCITVWGNISTTKMKRINHIILRLAKLVVSAKQRHKATKIDRLEQLGWMLFHERLHSFTLNFIFKQIWNKSSVQKSFHFFVKREDTGRCSRQEHNFIVPQMDTEFGKSSFFYRGIILWNSLPSTIKSSIGSCNFDVHVRKWIMDKRDNNNLLFYI